MLPQPGMLKIFENLFGKWRILKKIDEGGFGLVYQVEHIRTKRMAAFKAESNTVEGGSAIKLEVKVLQRLNRNKQSSRHVPKLYQCAKRPTFCYMILTLLGENLRTLRLNCVGERMRPQTWARLAVQCLYCIKLLHDIGYVHRDIKPANFTMGHTMDPQRCQYVHILDFGLARCYAWERNGSWDARRARSSAEFRGTARYCSPSVHEKLEQGRKDDLWSLLYMLIEMHCGLPWQKEKDKRKIEQKKLNIPDNILLMHMPEELEVIPAHLRQLNYYNRPDYFMIYSCFMSIIKRLKVKFSDVYDWEEEISISEHVSKYKADWNEWDKASEFFKSDPIKIDGPPSKEFAERTIDALPTVEENNEINSSILCAHPPSARSGESGPYSAEFRVSIVKEPIRVHDRGSKQAAFQPAPDRLIKRHSNRHQIV